MGFPTMSLRPTITARAPSMGTPVDVIRRITPAGVHGTSVTLHLERLWSQNITITTRLVDAVTTPLLLKTVMAGRLKPKQLITHHFTLDDIVKAYDTFGNAGRERALKVILTNT